MEVWVRGGGGRLAAVALPTGSSGLELKLRLCRQGFPAADVYLKCNGKLVDEEADLHDGAIYSLETRLVGGKGGFGSMLRALGAQIEKTTNREACRDLSGRRLRDVNHEKAMAEWIKKQAERETEKEQRRLERLQRRLAEPKHYFADPQYEQQLDEMSERLEDSVLKGLQASSSDVVAAEGGVRKRAHPTTHKAATEGKKRCLWMGVEGLEESGSSDEECVAESSSSESSPRPKSCVGQAGAEGGGVDDAMDCAPGPSAEPGVPKALSVPQSEAGQEEPGPSNETEEKGLVSQESEQPEAEGPTGAGPEAEGPTGAGPEAEGPTGARPEAEGPTGARPEAEGPTGERPEAEGPTGERPEAEGPTGERPEAEGPTGERPEAEGPTGERPEAEGPTGERPEAEGPTGARPEAEGPTGARPEAEGPTGARPEAEGPTGARPEAEGPTGARPEAEGPTGARPEAEGPTGARPEAEGPTGARPEAEGPTGARPEAEGPTGARPEAEGPTGERPEAEEPTGARPEAEGPTGERPEVKEEMGDAQNNMTASTTTEPGPEDWTAFNSAEELECLGLDRLKAELMGLGLKCGGTLRERAARLFSVKGLSREQIDPALFAKPAKCKKK